jgi:hypothetical protein
VNFWRPPPGMTISKHSRYGNLSPPMSLQSMLKHVLPQHLERWRLGNAIAAVPFSSHTGGGFSEVCWQACRDLLTRHSIVHGHFVVASSNRSRHSLVLIDL